MCPTQMADRAGKSTEQVVYHLRFEVWKISFTEEIQRFDFLISFLKQRHELRTSPRNLTCLSSRKLK